MFEIRFFKAGYDFKTGFLSKFFFILAVFLLVSFIVLKVFSLIFINSTGFIKIFYDISISTTPDTLLSFSLIFFAGSIISYFFYNQFVKLAEIAEEIEKGDEYKDKDF